MRFFRWFLIAVLIVLAVYHLKPYFADFQQIPDFVKNVNYLWLTLSALAIVGQYFGDGWLSQILLSITGHKISLRQTIKIASIDVFAAHILPIGETGVIAAAAYFYKKLGVGNQGIIFLTIAWGIITNTVLVIFLIASMLFLSTLPNIPIHISYLVKAAAVIILIAAAAAYVFRKTIIIFTSERFAENKIFAELQKFFQNLEQHKSNLLKEKLLVLEALAAALIYFAANIASLYFCFLAFGAAPQIAIVAFAYLLSLVASFITLAPAGIGTSEATMILVFLQFGINPPAATASVLVFRLFAFWLPIPAGLLAYTSLKKESPPKT